MVYGKKVLLPIEFQIKTFKTTSYLNLELTEAQKQRVAQLNELDETHISLNLELYSECRIPK